MKPFYLVLALAVLSQNSFAASPRYVTGGRFTITEGEGLDSCVAVQSFIDELRKYTKGHLSFKMNMNQCDQKGRVDLAYYGSIGEVSTKLTLDTSALKGQTSGFIDEVMNFRQFRGADDPAQACDHLKRGYELIFKSFGKHVKARFQCELYDGNYFVHMSDLIMNLGVSSGYQDDNSLAASQARDNHHIRENDDARAAWHDKEAAAHWGQGPSVHQDTYRQTSRRSNDTYSPDCNKPLVQNPGLGGQVTTACGTH